MPNYTPDPDTFKELANDHNLIPVYREISADLETPVSAYLKTATGKHSFLFESVEGGENLARYSMLGTEPSEVLTTGAGTEYGEVDPLNLLRERMSTVKYAHVEGLPKFHGGAVGYLAYDTIRYFEPTVQPISDEKSGLDIPEAVFMMTDSILIFDHVRHSIFVVSHAAVNSDIDAAYDRATSKIEEVINRLEQPVPSTGARRNFLPTSGFTSRDPNLDYSSVGHPDQAPIDFGEITGQPYIPNMSREYYGVNKGLDRATGDIIGILNGDDYYMHPRVLDLYADKFENTHIGIAFGDLEYFPPNRPDKTIRTYSSRKFTREKLRLGWMPPHPTTFIRRSVYDTIGKYSTDYNISSDFEFLIRALWLHGIEFDRIDSVVVRMQYGGLSTKGLVSTYRLNQEIIRACRSNGLKTGWPTIMLKFPEKLLEFAPALRM